MTQPSAQPAPVAAGRIPSCLPSPATGTGEPSTDSTPTFVLALPKIDAYNAPRLRAVLTRCDPIRHTVLDFSAVTLCGAAAIHALLEAHARHERHGGSFHVTGTRPEIRRMFALTHTTGLLDEAAVTGASAT